MKSKTSLRSKKLRPFLLHHTICSAIIYVMLVEAIGILLTQFPAIFTFLLGLIPC